MTGTPAPEGRNEPDDDVETLGGAFAESDLTAELEADHRRELEQEDLRPS